MAGLTATGFDRKTFSTIRAEIIAELQRTISVQLITNVSHPIGQIVDTFCGQLGEAWEALEEAYYGFDPNNAIGQQMVALSKLTGTQRRAATQGNVLATVNLDGGATYPAGVLVAHENGNEDNRWSNLNAVTTPAGAAANYQTTFVSETFGSTADVVAGQLTVIAETYSGWNSVTNAGDATPGEDLETIEELRLRREDELAASGSATLAGVVADVSQVTGVLDVNGYENTSAASVTISAVDVAPHGILIRVWDDSGAADNDIAQAIHDSRPAGIKSYGPESGTATAYDGSSKTESFLRVDEKVVEVNVVIDSATTVAAADVKAAIMAGFGTLNESGTKTRKPIGADVIYNALLSLPFDVDGVDDVTTFQIRFNGDSWGTSNLTVFSNEIATLVAASITVTGDVT